MAGSKLLLPWQGAESADWLRASFLAGYDLAKEPKFASALAAWSPRARGVAIA